MNKWLDSAWWLDGAPLETSNGQLVLNVPGSLSKRPQCPNSDRTTSEKQSANSAKVKVPFPKQNLPLTLRKSWLAESAELDKQPEMNLRENLDGRPLNGIPRCPECGSRACFDRTIDIAGTGDTKYLVRCSRENHGCITCEYPPSPPFKILRDAAVHWSLTIKLAK
jgi:hypothetical protein